MCTQYQSNRQVAMTVHSMLSPLKMRQQLTSSGGVHSFRVFLETVPSRRTCLWRAESTLQPSLFQGLGLLYDLDHVSMRDNSSTAGLLDLEQVAEEVKQLPGVPCSDVLGCSKKLKPP
eukprot:2054863-Amphidinium_carterae.1